MESAILFEKDKKLYLIDICKKLILIVFYFLIMMVLSDSIALGVKNIFPDMDSNLFTIIMQYVIYIPLFIAALICIFKDVKESIKVFNSKKVGLATGQIFAGLAMCYMGNILGSVISNTLDPMASNSANENYIREIFASKWGMLIVLDVCIIGPIVEELVFRGAIQKGLMKLKIHPLVALIIASTVFGFIHVIDAGDYLQVFPYILMGLGLGYTYYFSNSLVSSIGVHIAINTISTSLQFFIMILEALGLGSLVGLNALAFF